jgi:hypothetical protein
MLSSELGAPINSTWNKVKMELKHYCICFQNGDENDCSN